MLLSLTAPPATGYNRLAGHRSSERDPRASPCRASQGRSAVLSLDSRLPALPHGYPLVAGLLVAPILAIAAWQFQVLQVRLDLLDRRVVQFRQAQDPAGRGWVHHALPHPHPARRASGQLRTARGPVQPGRRREGTARRRAGWAGSGEGGGGAGEVRSALAAARHSAKRPARGAGAGPSAFTSALAPPCRLRKRNSQVRNIFMGSPA